MKEGAPQKTRRIESLGLKALAVASLLASPIQARPPTHRVEIASVSHRESRTPRANEYCRQVVARAWALVRSGRVVERGGLNFEDVLDCFPTAAQRNQFMDAHDAIERSTGGVGSQVMSQN